MLALNKKVGLLSIRWDGHGRMHLPPGRLDLAPDSTSDDQRVALAG